MTKKVKKHLNKNVVENFEFPRNKKGILEKYILVYFPFFIRIPVELFLWVLGKGFKNPVYFLILFASFAIIKKVVRSNTYEWSYYTNLE